MNNIITSHDSETLATGQQVITACAFIHHNFDGKVKLFLPRRAMTKKFLPGVFEFPGGHIDFGEEIVEGLKREILEEMNMNITVGDPFYVFTYTNEIKGSHSIEVIYFAKFVEDVSNIKLNPEDHSEYIWLSEDEVESKLAILRDSEDKEIDAIRKGFKLLKGGNLLLS